MSYKTNGGDFLSDYKFGVGGSDIDGVEFKNMWAKVFSSGGAQNPVPPSEVDPSNPNAVANLPGRIESPNYPRAKGRIVGYQNPILGDVGEAQIKRGQTVKIDALENVLEHIIEYYVRDKNWYKNVRAREALWNMYRRVKWFVEEQTDPHQSQYQRCLEMIKDCIYKILDPASEVYVEDFLSPDGKTIHALTDMTYSGGSYEEFSGGFRLKAKSGQSAKAARKYKSTARGDIIFQYSSDMDVHGTANIKIDGKKVWEIAHPSQNQGHAHRDVKIEVPVAKEFTIEFEVVGSGTYECILEMRDMDWVGLIQQQDDEDVPYCPLPYEHRFDVDYFNHFDGSTIERPVLDMRDFPLLDGFPDFFRYMSSTEDVEWELVHSSNGNGVAENLLKMDVNKLVEGNSSKLTWNWRFKRDGYVEFEYLASTAKGNGTSFFINERQVGGAWSEEKGWKTAKFNVTGNQMYKFDIMVRKTNHVKWGLNALFIRNIRLCEVIHSEKEPAPPSVENWGEVISDKWYMYMGKSKLATYYEGFADGVDDLRRTVVMELDNECDGEVSWEYLMGVARPDPSEEETWFFIQNFIDFLDWGESTYGSSVESEADKFWIPSANYMSTVTDGARIDYDIHVGDNCTVKLVGGTRLTIPERRLDHYIKVPMSWTLGDFTWNRTGDNSTKWSVASNEITMVNPSTGTGSITTNVHMDYDGFVEFYIDENLKDGERLQILLDGAVVGVAINGDKHRDYFRIPISKGDHTFGFNLTSYPSYTSDLYEFSRRLYYGGSRRKTYDTPGNNELYIEYNGYFDEDAHKFEDYGEIQNMELTLRPGDSFHYKERMSFMPYVAPLPEQPEPELVWEDLMQGGYSSEVSTRGTWDVVDVFEHFTGYGYGDEVLLSDASAGAHRVFIDLESLGFELGYFEFEYGAKFSGSGKLTLKADGDTLWSTSRDDTSLGGTTVKVELPPGTKELEFVYNA